jgi:hypothetical protein
MGGGKDMPNYPETDRKEKSKMKSGFAFHCHHDKLFECVWDFDKRVKYIKEWKRPEEVELRLRLFKMIPTEFMPGKDSIEWKMFNQTRETYTQTWETFDQVRVRKTETHAQVEEDFIQAEEDLIQAEEDFIQAEEDYIRAEKIYTIKYDKEITELHNKLCPNCPWNGKTIFGKKGEE